MPELRPSGYNEGCMLPPVLANTKEKDSASLVTNLRERDFTKPSVKLISKAIFSNVFTLHIKGNNLRLLT